MQAPKVCTKLALVGRAKRKGVLATLYLKLALPLSDGPVVYPLFPKEDGITLQRWYVHGLNANQEAPALDTSAATAASALKISISADDEPSEKCQITKDSHINLSAPPLAALSASQPSRKSMRTDKRWFMVTLHLHIPYKLQPPRDPHLIRVPLPPCLNNRCKFTVEEEAYPMESDGELTVEVDPPLLPKGKAADLDDGTATQRAESLYGSDSEDEDESVLTGRFIGGTGGLSIRWALAAHLPLVQADSADIASHVKPAKASSLAKDIKIDFTTVVTLKGLHLPTLAPSTILRIDTVGEANLVFSAVTADTGVRAWHAHTAGETEPDATVRSTVASPRASGLMNLFSQPPPPQHPQAPADESDLWHTSPPIEFNGSRLDFSVDVSTAEDGPTTWWKTSGNGVDILLDPVSLCGHATGSKEEVQITLSGSYTVKPGDTMPAPRFDIKQIARSPTCTIVAATDDFVISNDCISWAPITADKHEADSSVMTSVPSGDAPASEISTKSNVLRAGSPHRKQPSICPSLTIDIFVPQNGAAVCSAAMEVSDAMREDGNISFVLEGDEVHFQAGSGGRRIQWTSEHSDGSQRINFNIPDRQTELQWTTKVHNNVLRLPSFPFDISRLEVKIVDNAKRKWHSGPGLRSFPVSFDNVVVFGVTVDQRVTLIAENVEVITPPPSELGATKDKKATVSSASILPSLLAIAVLALSLHGMMTFVQQQKREIQRLGDEVKLLSMAANLDFAPGSWQEPSPPQPETIDASPDELFRPLPIIPEAQELDQVDEFAQGSFAVQDVATAPEQSLQKSDSFLFSVLLSPFHLLVQRLLYFFSGRA